MSTAVADKEFYSPAEIGAIVAKARGGGPTHPATVMRWILRGCRVPGGGRVHLRASRLGGRWLIRRDDLGEFLADCAGPLVTTEESAPRTPTQRKRSHERAQKELAKYGI